VARSSTSCSAALAVVLAVVIAGARPARADEPPWYKGVSKATRTQVSAMFEKGNTYFEQNEYTKAAEIYFEAVKLWNHPGIQFNLAVSLMNLDRPLEAHEHLEAALEFGPSGLEKTRYQEAQTYKRLLEGRLVVVTVETTQDGVDVTLDGKRIQSGKGRAEIIVLPGAHALVATKRGYETVTKNLTFIGGTPDTEKLTLAPKIVVTHRYRGWVPWTVVGTGLGVGLLGGGAIWLAHRHEQRYEDQFAAACPEGCALHEPGASVDWNLHDRASLEQTIGFGAASAGAAIVLTGLVMVALNQPREVPFPGSVAVISTPHELGLVWAGGF
jgi:tetratricopeptide (TPR) repeat protein